MEKIENKSFDMERALYNKQDLELSNVKFFGPLDGESALKECSNIRVIGSSFNLSYPCWHDKGLKLDESEMTDNARAAIWYGDGIEINNSSLLGIKAIRECNNVKISNSTIKSEEFGWKSKDIYVANTKLDSIYAFLDSSDIHLNNVDFKGKYSFQYVKNLEIRKSRLDTKDAFWHSDGVVVKDSVIKGEYLGWYSKNLTLINCKIIGTQPLCYCEGLRLINCTMLDTDLAFEYSDVMADINSSIDSVKNPKSGYIKAKAIKEIILDNSKYPNECKIEVEE